jgi:glyceraldehyde-3-phosphate dehydrogenase/erythrose-4-phosphate dehydrogenase
MVRKFNIIQFVIQKNYLEENNIDVVIENRFFLQQVRMQKILKQAKSVIISAPTKKVDIPNVVHGVNCRRKN